MTTMTDGEITEALASGDFGIGAPGFDLEEQLQPTSIDLRIAHEFRTYRFTPRVGEALDPRDLSPGDTELHVVPSGQWWLLEPGEFVLGTTVETVVLGPQVLGRVEGRSTYGRLGVTAHITAGFIDPGFEGQITLEIANLNSRPVILRPGARICQLSLEMLSRPCARPYGFAGNKYQNQRGVQGPRSDTR